MVQSAMDLRLDKYYVLLSAAFYPECLLIFLFVYFGYILRRREDIRNKQIQKSVDILDVVLPQARLYIILEQSRSTDYNLQRADDFRIEPFWSVLRKC